MKRSLPIIFSLFLCHCGTEVGNGVTTDNDGSGGAKSDAAPGGSTEGSTTNDTSTPTSAAYTPFVVQFITACASPFSESISGTFTLANSQNTFIASTNANGQKLVTANNMLIYTITPAPTVSPYAIEALAVSPKVTCTSINTQTLQDGSIQRTATLSSGETVSWILQAGTVTSMRAVLSAGTSESWSKTSP